MRTHDRLRIAIQKSGRLSDPARDLLARAGLSFRESRDRLFCYGESLPIDLLLVRDDDIPGLIAEGVCDLGIVGRNVLEEQAARTPGRRQGRSLCRDCRTLGFGRCRLSVAVPNEWDWKGTERLAGTRIATSYPQSAGALAARPGHRRRTGGAVRFGGDRAAPGQGREHLRPGVFSGATLVANQLKEVAVHPGERSRAGRPGKTVRRRARRARRDAAAPARRRAEPQGQQAGAVPGATRAPCRTS